MYGNISDEEANELIKYMSDNVRKNFVKRSIVETPLFPVSHYIHTATYTLYDQAYQYNVLKEVAKVLPPEKLGRRNKTFSVVFNQLAINSLAMLYLHGRAQCLFDNIEYNKKNPSSKVEVEPEEKKKETKFILDYWKRLSPNYRNDGKLTVEDGTIRVLSQDLIEKLRSEMVPVHDQPELVRKLKRATAVLTSRTFLAHAECRAGIFEQGPYETDSPDEVLIFKDFVGLYTGNLPYGLDEMGKEREQIEPLVKHLFTKAKSPVDNIIFGMTLKNIGKIEYNDWGTMFTEPSDYTKNITSVGVWTKEPIHPKNMRYPDKLGEINLLPFDTLDSVQTYAQDAINEIYLDVATWPLLKKLLTGFALYANAVVAVASFYAGLEDKFDWSWPIDILNDEQHSDLIDTQAVKGYIKKLEKFPFQAHPFLSRIFRRKKKHREDPLYYYLQD